MDLAQVWRHYFDHWPTGLGRNGVVVTSHEQVAFVSFLMSETVIMFERRAPDSLGGRKVVLPYALIQAVKITEPIGNEPFLKSGFSESLRPVAQRPANQAGPGRTATPTVAQKAS